jgi:hypothetical protein
MNASDAVQVPLNGDVTDLRIGNRRIKYGTILRFTGVRGEFEFRKAHVIDGVCESLQVVGGTDSRNGFRYFAPDKIAKVVRVPKTKRFAHE